jgi:citrate lyase subunit beta/citryl-CoA lyase
MVIAEKLDELGKPAWIALMVLSFIVFWPLGLAIPDIEACISPAIAALALPKVMGPDHIRLLSEHVAECEERQGMEVGTTRFIAMVETAEAYFRMEAIAKADSRVVALTLGAEDFATSVGMAPEPEFLFGPKQTMLIAAAAAGVLPMGFVGSIAEFRDVEAFRATIRRSRKMGFRGSGAIHPNQVKVMNEEFAPHANEVEYARRVVDAYAEAYRQGRGAVTLDGRMIDVPIVERAQALLDWQAALDERLQRAS